MHEMSRIYRNKESLLKTRAKWHDFCPQRGEITFEIPFLFVYMFIVTLAASLLLNKPTPLGLNYYAWKIGALNGQ